MCGILAGFGLTGSREETRRLALAQSRKLRHRGPDANSIYQTADGTGFLAHERLNIVDASERGRCCGAAGACGAAAGAADGRRAQAALQNRQGGRRRCLDDVRPGCALIATLRRSGRSRTPPRAGTLRFTTTSS